MENPNYEQLDNDLPSRMRQNRCKRNYAKTIIALILVFIVGCGIGILIAIAIYRPRGIVRDNDFNALSQKLQQQTSVAFMKDQLNMFAGQIHQAGSIRNLQLAETMKNNWKSWGLESVTISKYRINKTVVRPWNPSIVRLLDGNVTVANLTTMEENATLPVYHGYSIGGHARGSVVFINYGLDKDLQALKALNVTFCGSKVILIARLGFSIRSTKVRNVLKVCGTNLPGGILVYPDPWDFAVNPNNKSSTPDNTPVYPNSWWLPGDAAVFGSMKMLSGLQSPGLPSLEGIFETVDLAKMQTPLPVQPISYNDASKIFQFLSKVPVPLSWERCLPKYLESADKLEIEMIINNNIEVATLANVIGSIPGSVDKDRYVILGNHRDAWVTGASDPGSGTVILQQVAMILGNAYKQGLFKPYRSVLFASWDGEEEGLIGSNEFTNQFSADLLAHCVSYINMDCPIKGSWSFNGRATPLMIGPMLESAKNVWIDSRTLFQDWLHKMPKLPNKIEPKVNYLGGGSDHISFAYVLGIPSAYPEYKFNESLANMPVYHTRYDNIDMMLKWIDPQLVHHKLVSQFVIDYIIRFSYSPLIPYSIDRLIDLLIGSFPDLRSLMDTIPFLRHSNYSNIVSDQLTLLQQASISFRARIDGDKDLLRDSYKLRQINDILLRLPRMFLTRDGLPTRPYLRNILLATKLKNSYQGSVFTGVYDSVDLFHQGKVNLTVVLRQLSLLSNCLRRTIDLFNGEIVSII